MKRSRHDRSLLHRANYYSILRNKIRSGIANTASLSSDSSIQTTNKEVPSATPTAIPSQPSFVSSTLPTPLGLNNSTLHLDPVSEVKGSTGLSSDILAPLSADRLTMVKEKGAYSVPFVIQFHVDNSPCFHVERKLSCPPISPEHFGSRASRQPTPEAPVSIADRSLRVASLPWRSDSLGRCSSRLFLPS